LVRKRKGGRENCNRLNLTRGKKRGGRFFEAGGEKKKKDIPGAWA